MSKEVDILTYDVMMNSLPQALREFEIFAVLW